MATDLQVVITGKDGVSRVFKEISASAKTAGDAVERAGTEGKAGLDKIEQAAKTADRSVDSISKTAGRASVDFDKFGAAAVAIGAGLAYAGNAALDQQQTIIGLQAAYGDAADEYIRFADEIASRSIFNDDDILRGERYFATLRTQYGLADEQLKALMQTTADLASASGTSFEDASSRITAAIRGEAEAAEYLGLTLNQQSIDRGNLTLSMTNQEAAQFRLAALNDQAAQFSGTAQALAESEVGARARLVNAFQDQVQAVGALIGPQQALIASAASGAVGIAQFAGGFGPLAAGIRTATIASRAFILSPLGLVVTATAGALALATGAFLSNRNEAAAASAEWESAEASASSLTDQINQMALAGNIAESRWADSFANQLEGQFNQAREELEKLTDLGFHDTSWLDQYVTDVLVGQGQTVGGPNWLNNFTSTRNEMVAELMPTEADRAALNDAMSSLFELMLEPEVDGARVRDRMQDIFADFDPALGIDGLIEEFAKLEAETLRYVMALDSTELAINNLASAQANWQALGAGSIGAMTEETQQYEAAVVGAVESNQELALAERERIDARGKHEQEAAAAQDAYWEEQRQRTEEGHEADRQRAVDREAQAGRNRAALGLEAAGYTAIAAEQERSIENLQEMQALVTSLMGLDDPLTALNASGMANEFSLTAAAIRDAGTALDDTFRIVVGNTDAIADQTRGVADWIDGLVGAKGEWAAIDDLQRQGRISVDEYNAALDAQGRINSANYEIQWAVRDIQVTQAPLIATQTEALERQLGVISTYSAEQQLVTLGWMDQASAAKAMEI